MSHPNLTEVAGALLSEELLDILDRLFPNRCPNPRDTDREIWMKAGECRAVEKMRSWFDHANKSNVPVIQEA